jgi:biotin carboxyl carrier protein
MTAESFSAESAGHRSVARQDSSAKPAVAPRSMSVRNRLLFFLVAWLIVLMPVLFWWGTWFGRPLSDKQISTYLNDEKHPRHIQHGLVQLGERMGRRDPIATQWYPDLVRLASHPVEEVRNTDAWVMGQDTSGAGLHEALLKMLHDPSAMVQGNAALSLVRFGDASGRAQIVALLKPATIIAPIAGQVIDADKLGTAVHQGGLIAKVRGGEQTAEVRSPIGGRIGALTVAIGAHVDAGNELATVEPGAEQVWEALRALYLIGQAEDLEAVRLYERESQEISDRVRQQAILTEKAIRERAEAPR